jgi:hypothetical protein
LIANLPEINIKMSIKAISYEENKTALKVKNLWPVQPTYLRRLLISSRKALSVFLSLERGVSSLSFARVGALSNKRRS